MLRVFVVSRLPAVRAGLRVLLSSAPDCEVVGEADRVEALPQSELVPHPDVVVLEVDAQADVDWRGLYDEITGSGPGLLILGPVPPDPRLSADLAGRAWGYLPRDTSAEQLIAAVRAVGGGLVVLHPSVTPPPLGAPALFDGPTTNDEDLTAREREVLELLALGLANKTIASRLQISEHTVKFHVAAILSKLGAGSRTEAVHLGARRGLVAL